MQHDQTLQRALSPTPEGKAAWETVKILFSAILTFSDLYDKYILHRFLVLPPPFRKSRDEISFTGRAVTPRVTLFPNYFHYKLGQASSAMVNHVVEVQN
jgi:hypothetical protein